MLGKWRAWGGMQESVNLKFEFHEMKSEHRGE